MERKNDYEKIETLQDAIRKLGPENALVKEYYAIICSTGQLSEDLLAYLRLRIITAALNGEWKPDFEDIKQKKYWPLFFLYTQPEWENISEEVRKSGVFFGGNANNGAYCGFLYESTNSAPSYAYAYIGSQLCYKSAELAKYAGKQFVDIYFDFVIGGYGKQD